MIDHHEHVRKAHEEDDLLLYSELDWDDKRIRFRRISELERSIRNPKIEENTAGDRDIYIEPSGELRSAYGSRIAGVSKQQMLSLIEEFWKKVADDPRLPAGLTHSCYYWADYLEHVNDPIARSSLLP